jgi:UDP-N-acetylmuramate-alanine ligase
VTALVKERKDGDLVVFMSNGGFGGIHQKTLNALGA